MVFGNVVNQSSLYFRVYCPVLIFFFLVISLARIILFFSYALSNVLVDPSKLAAYECGFDPFNDARRPFDVRFYLVAILFLLFDVEATFLFPWCASLASVSSFGYWAMVDFLVELLVGFIYAWKLGGLDWD
jgi:NADH:ubiquinone oxidoreductase subunit 3 (subunit A)